MKTGNFYLNCKIWTALVCSVIFVSVSELEAQTMKVFEEVNGYVAVEAEYYLTQKNSEIRKWYRYDMGTPPSDTIADFLSGASGNAYLQILPDTRITHQDRLIQGVNFSNIPGVMGIIKYQVHFNTPGRYYVWVRCYSNGSEDNGIHVGIDGSWPESGQRLQWCEGKNTWRWESKQRTLEVHCGVPGLIYLDVPESGIHTIAFSMREDGFRFDKWIMTTNAGFSPPLK